MVGPCKAFDNVQPHYLLISAPFQNLKVCQVPQFVAFEGVSREKGCFAAVAPDNSTPAVLPMLDVPSGSKADTPMLKANAHKDASESAPVSSV
eukprot:scaffold260593_cov18-Tisochrysis_lutea.AAC.1